MNKKILIVRGDRQNAKALSFLLAGSGYQISTHSTAGEAVEAARHQRFDLAITDEAVPENQPNLGFVANLKEAQPTLPIFFLSNEQTLETVINCIRAGVTEVLQNPADLRNVLETTNSYLRGAERQNSDDEVTWEDILEVERLLEASIGQDAGAGSGPARGSGASSSEVEALKRQVESLLADRDRISGDLAATLSNLQKSRAMIDELKGSNGNRSTDTEINDRALELDKRESKLKELATKISQQKVELETQLGEIEAQKIELEEAQKEVKDNLDANPAALYSLNKEFEEERAKMQASRLEYQSRIQKLEQSLAEAKDFAARSEELEEALRKAREEVQDMQDLVAEKDFLIEQRDRELEEAKKPENLSQPLIEELEQEKRLVEIEKHKLQEKRDQFELERRQAEDTHKKHQREIQVERRDAEVSLREMQNAIKEEQLKLRVEQASLKEEMRQFEQARQNFQEDVRDLQSKQAELRKMEAYLQQVEKNIKVSVPENTLPKPDSSALDPLQPSEAATTPIGTEITEGPGSPAPKEPAKEEVPSGTPDDPNSWGKPNFEKKAGRGPLRIGRRSAF